MEVIWSDLAWESLYEITSYVQNFFGQKTADNIASKIISFVDTLGRFPRMGKQLSHLSGSSEIRCVFYKQNHIYYQIFDDRIEIILIWDSRQDSVRLRNILAEFLGRQSK